jgi:hypothetical protein
MEVFRHTLVCDGSTDASLIPILNWVLRQRGGLALTTGVRAEFWRLARPPQTLEDKIKCALDLYPCRLLFVHRDAEKQPPSARHEEIRNAVENVASTGTGIPAVAVVPVRMLEAWLLLDEHAIRQAAGNPNGTQLLDLPPASRLEERPNPKHDLHQALRSACGLHGRRLKKFNVGHAFSLITDYQQDFAPLRQLPAFCELEQAVARLAEARYAPGFYGFTA